MFSGLNTTAETLNFDVFALLSNVDECVNCLMVGINTKWPRIVNLLLFLLNF